MPFTAEQLREQTDGLTRRLRFTVVSDGLHEHDLVAGRDDDLHSAHYWTLHLHVSDPAAAWQAVRATGAECLTGEYVGGDSWAAWCESNNGDDDLALHVSFLATGPERAERAALALLDLVYPDQVKPGWNLSTSLDWSQQWAVAR